MTDTPIDEWSGAIIDMPSCNCLCFAVHPERGICDVESPRALLSMDTAGSMPGDQGVREIVTCKPCAEAAAATNPGARGVVVLAAAAP